MRLELKELYDIKNIVKIKAKYQKVMLMYDDSVSEIDIRDIYELIRNDCVYNQMNVANIDHSELMNGYRLVVFYMTGQNYLKLDIETDEFVNIFIPTDEYLIPFFLSTGSEKSKGVDYLILNGHSIDDSLISCVYVNRIYSRIYNLIYSVDENINYEQIDATLCGQNLIEIMGKEMSNLKFIDLKILREGGLKIDKLILLDYILLVAFELFVQSIRNRSLSIIDVYKVAQNDGKKINVYYEMMNNYQLVEILNLNFNCLTKIIKTHKDYILQLLKDSYSKDDVNQTINALSNFARNDEGILGYLYFYNILP